MKREHSTLIYKPEPTLWCEFDGNLNDSSPNNYSPLLLYNNTFQFYNNSSIIGASNKCVRYTLDKFTDTGDFSLYERLFPTSYASTAFLFTCERVSNTNNYACVNCYAGSNGTVGLMVRQYDNDSNHFASDLGISLTLNTWNEVLFIRKNGVLYAYKDGDLKSQQIFTYNMFNQNMPCFDISNSYLYQYGNRYFRGYIDEFKFWHNTAIL